MLSDGIYFNLKMNNRIKKGLVYFFVGLAKAKVLQSTVFSAAWDLSSLQKDDKIR